MSTTNRYVAVAVATPVVATAAVGVLSGSPRATAAAAMTAFVAVAVAVAVSLRPWLRSPVTAGQRAAALSLLPADLVARGRQRSAQVRPLYWALQAVSLAMIGVMGWCGSAVVDATSRAADPWWLRVAVAGVVLGAVRAAAIGVPLWRKVAVEVRYATKTGVRPGKTMFITTVGMVAVFWAFVVVLAAAIHRWPDWWWLVLTGIVIAYHGLARLIPAVVAGGTTVSQPRLQQRLAGIAEQAGVRVGRITVVDRPDHGGVDAMVGGLGRWRRIVVCGPGLAAQPPAHPDGRPDASDPTPGPGVDDVGVDDVGVEDEIAVMVAHEVAHPKHGDQWIRMVLSGARAALILAAVALAGNWPGLLHLAGATSLSDPHAVGLILAILSIAGMLTKPVQSWLALARERRADRYALDATGDATAVIALQQRTLRTNGIDPDPDLGTLLIEPDLRLLAHPSVAERIATALDGATVGEDTRAKAPHAATIGTHAG